MGNITVVKVLYEKVFDWINNKLPYVEYGRMDFALKVAYASLKEADVCLLECKSELDSDAAAIFEFYSSLAKGCLNAHEMIYAIQKGLNERDVEHYKDMMKSLDDLRSFIQHFENEAYVVDKVEKFLVHLTAMEEYFRAVLMNELGFII